MSKSNPEETKLIYSLHLRILKSQNNIEPKFNRLTSFLESINSNYTLISGNFIPRNDTLYELKL